jgi:hypothetical protein
MASGGGYLEPGTRVYLPYLRKYFIKTDFCASCGSNAHLDLFLGPNDHEGQNLLACQEAVTRGEVKVLINPTRGCPVNTALMYANEACQLKFFPDQVPSGGSDTTDDGGDSGGGEGGVAGNGEGVGIPCRQSSDCKWCCTGKSGQNGICQTADNEDYVDQGLCCFEEIGDAKCQP